MPPNSILLCIQFITVFLHVLRPPSSIIAQILLPSNPLTSATLQFVCETRECFDRAWLPECRNCPAIVPRFAFAYGLSAASATTMTIDVLLARLATIHDQRHQSMVQAIQSIVRDYDAMLLAILQSDRQANQMATAAMSQIRRYFTETALLPQTDRSMTRSDTQRRSNLQEPMQDALDRINGLRSQQLRLELKYLKICTAHLAKQIEHSMRTTDCRGCLSQLSEQVSRIDGQVKQLTLQMNMTSQPDLEQFTLDIQQLESQLDETVALYKIMRRTPIGRRSISYTVDGTADDKSNERHCFTMQEFLDRMPVIVVPMPAANLWYILITPASASWEGKLYDQKAGRQISEGYSNQYLVESSFDIPTF